MKNKGVARWWREIIHKTLYKKGSVNGKPARKHKITGNIQIQVKGFYYPEPIWLDLLNQNEAVFTPNNKGIEYVVIAGYRRWLACKYLNQPVQAIIKELTLSEAVGVLVSENEKESVCDYSKGMFYSK